VIETTTLRIAGFFSDELQLIEIGFLLNFASTRVFSKLHAPYRFRNCTDPSFIE
jgi:hypothetical protein